MQNRFLRFSYLWLFVLLLQFASYHFLLPYTIKLVLPPRFFISIISAGVLLPKQTWIHAFYQLYFLFCFFAIILNLPPKVQKLCESSMFYYIC